MFVRDGFYFWAFLLTPLWLLWHRLWLVLLIYLVVIVGIEQRAALCRRRRGRDDRLSMLLISLLIGLEASTLRRFTLARRGWRNVGVVGGDDVEAAERRFFDAWAAGARPGTTSPVRGGRLPPHVRRRSRRAAAARADIIGLFPEPGAPR